MIDECFREMKAVSDLNDVLLIGKDSGLYFAGDSDVLFEKMPIQQAFAGSDYIPGQATDSNQSNLLAF